MDKISIYKYFVCPINSYEDFVFESWKYQSYTNIALKILAFVALPVVYPVLGLLHLVGRISTYQMRANNASLLKEQVKQLRNSGREGWREEAIALIRHSRYDDPEDELQRLRDVGVLTPAMEIRLDQAEKQVHIEAGTMLTREKRQHIKALYAQAMEIKQIYGDDYYVFLHAQASPWILISYLVKELWRKANPQADLHQFKPLRAPCSTAEPGFFESLYQAYHARSRGAAQYSERWFSSLIFSDHDPKVREELLSCDLLFCNFSRCESAFHFLTNNINILHDNGTIEKLAAMAIGHFFPQSSPDQIRNHVKSIVNKLSSIKFPCGNLFTICIPKNSPDLKNIFYRAHPFGVKCGCHPAEQDVEIANKLQNDLLDHSTKCQSLLGSKVPQYRIYLPAIHRNGDASKQFKTFLLNPLSKRLRKALKEKIRDVVDQISNNQQLLAPIQG